MRNTELKMRAQRRASRLTRLAIISGIVCAVGITTTVGLSSETSAIAASQAQPHVPSLASEMQRKDLQRSELRFGENACLVNEGTMSWGVKQSFRSYINSAIARGTWRTDGGAHYTTPNFYWNTPSADLSDPSGNAQISFSGNIVFLGHNDVLKLEFANPVISVHSRTTGTLLMDARSNSPSGEVILDEKAVPIAQLSFPEGAWAEHDGWIRIPAIDAKLTEAGVPAFARFYSAGDALDPISLELNVSQCSSWQQWLPTDSDQNDGLSTSQWAVVAGGGVILLLGAGVILNKRRNRSKQ